MKEIYEVSDEYLNSQLKYLKLLSRKYSSVSEASAEIINLKAILNLPKGTEHFLSDIYGEYSSDDIDECKSLVKELIDKDYAILKDFDNRCDRLIELLKKELDLLKG